jgi:hypothetical protein
MLYRISLQTEPVESVASKAEEPLNQTQPHQHQHEHDVLRPPKYTRRSKKTSICHRKIDGYLADDEIMLVNNYYNNAIRMNPASRKRVPRPNNVLFCRYIACLRLMLTNYAPRYRKGIKIKEQIGKI